jgi:phospholipid/cholesterol/gamma-HCH transport system substrate-binding protein
MSLPQTFLNKNHKVLLFHGILGAVILAIAGLWYFLHPNSPYVERTEYIVLFHEIGSLKPGNGVTVNGLKYGVVRDMQMHGDSVLVTVAVLSHIKIPVNSRFILQNVGLMGERIVAIQLGNSQQFANSSVVFKGSFDDGSTRLGYKVNEVVQLGLQVKDTVTQIVDSTVLHKESLQKIKNTLQGIAKFEPKLVQMTDSLMTGLQEFENQVQAMQSTLDTISTTSQVQISQIQAQIPQLQARFAGIQSQANQLKTHFLSLGAAVTDSTKTVGAFLKMKDLCSKFKGQ